MLDIEIDRRGLDALAVLGRRHHAFGKNRLRHAPAMRAAVNRGLMFRDPQRALGKVEHLPLLDPYRRPRLERPTAMAACARRVPNHAIGIGDLPQRAALMTRLPAARLARTAAQTAPDTRFLPQPVTRRRLRTVRAVPPQLPAKIGHLGPKRRDLRPQRRYQLLDFDGKNHPTLDSQSRPAVSRNPHIKAVFPNTVAFRTHHTLGVTGGGKSSRKPLKANHRAGKRRRPRSVRPSPAPPRAAPL